MNTSIRIQESGVRDQKKRELVSLMRSSGTDFWLLNSFELINVRAN